MRSLSWPTEDAKKLITTFEPEPEERLKKIHGGDVDGRPYRNSGGKSAGSTLLRLPRVPRLVRERLH